MRLETPVAITSWTCRCGLEFRTARYEDGWVFWPANGPSSYSQRELLGRAPCPCCGEPVGAARAASR
jgi:hypothetical protein